MKKFRKSKTRDKILAVLVSTTKHPTADWIYQKVKQDVPTLSLGTVYRNLNILQEMGLVKKIEHGSTFDRFDANTSPHFHFVCEKCGDIIDFNLDINLPELVEEKLNSTVNRQKVEFFGICEKCCNPE